MKEYQTQRFAAQKAEAQLVQARAELKSGETDLERLIVRAPVDGQVLQLKVHPGEFAPDAATAVGQPPLILFGSVTPLHVRVDVDENDAWRVRAGATASGYLRGNKNIKVPLTFVRFEPYVVPKKSLTGDSTERVDTRVLQVIFSFERGDLPIFVGQQMDVFIDAPEARKMGARLPPRADHEAEASFPHYATGLKLRFDFLSPKTEMEWGAHAPRVPFSAPSRKTLSALKSSGGSERSRAQGAGREARPAAPVGGCAPHSCFRVK